MLARRIAIRFTRPIEVVPEVRLAGKTQMGRKSSIFDQKSFKNIFFKTSSSFRFWLLDAIQIVQDTFLAF